jgi:hypothetical protein
MERFSKIQKFRKINEQEISLPKKEENKEEETVKKDIETKEETNNDSTPVKFFSKLFEARQMAHIFHLQVKGDVGSHATHIALNEFYDKLLGLIDELIETYTGQYNIIEGYENIDTSISVSTNNLEYFIELTKLIKNSRYLALSEDDTHLQNIIDEIVTLTYRLIYKLRFNK